MLRLLFKCPFRPANPHSQHFPFFYRNDFYVFKPSVLIADHDLDYNEMLLKGVQIVATSGPVSFLLNALLQSFCRLFRGPPYLGTPAAFFLRKKEGCELSDSDIWKKKSVCHSKRKWGGFENVLIGIRK